MVFPPWFGMYTLTTFERHGSGHFFSAKLRQENLENRAAIRMYSQLPRGANGQLCTLTIAIWCHARLGFKAPLIDALPAPDRRYGPAVGRAADRWRQTDI